MKIFRILFNLILTPAAALAGNWIGGQIRARLTGETVQTIQFEHTTASGMQMKNFPVSTKLYPALLFAFVGQPRWLFALLGGVLASLYIDDKYEAMLLENVFAPLIENTVAKKQS